VCFVACFKLSLCNFCWLPVCIILDDTSVLFILCVFVELCVYLFTLNTVLLARSQYSEVPATGHLETGSQNSKLPLHAPHVALLT